MYEAKEKRLKKNFDEKILKQIKQRRVGIPTRNLHDDMRTPRVWKQNL